MPQEDLQVQRPWGGQVRLCSRKEKPGWENRGLRSDGGWLDGDFVRTLLGEKPCACSD